MNGFSHLDLDPDYSEFVEVDPTGRYGRYNEVLGKGASKTVYRAFDEYEGIEVAWNQVKLYDFLQSPEDLERLYCEIHLLKTLKHKNIMKFYTSWVDTANRNINFVTEMFTSGTLRQYRLKHKRVNIRAVKHWCRQILRGLLYLHSHDPPVIHRDLKCDNIFVNGNQGEVKIGDLGLAAILRKSHAAHCVGTPEFMAPEVYEEAYNELVDIYSFGMCILEMVTFEYPYSECTHPAQIYKKVISGRRPDALYKVKDPEVRQFVEKCLATVSLRLSARELLNDPFLQLDDGEPNFKSIDYGEENGMGPLIRQPYYDLHDDSYPYSNGYSNVFGYYGYEPQNALEYHPVDFEPSGIELFEHHDDEHSANLDISIKGKRRDDGGIFLRLRIADKDGRKRNIYFPFDIETDTALSVATEMVAELDITDQDVTKIADMIDEEIASLVPEWRPGPGIVETPCFANQNLCQNCASGRTSNGSLIMDFLSNNPCRNGCASMHGRFEEITFQEADDSEHHLSEVGNMLNHSDCLNYQAIWGQHESRELTPVGSGRSHSDEEYEKFDPSISSLDENVKLESENQLYAKKKIHHSRACSFSGIPPLYSDPSDSNENKRPIHHSRGSGSLSELPPLHSELSDSNENKMQQELRWLKAKYQIELRKLRDQQLEFPKCSTSSNINLKLSDGVLSSTIRNSFRENSNEDVLESSLHEKLSDLNLQSDINKSCPNSDTQRARNCEAMKESRKTGAIGTAKSFYNKSYSLHRTTSLPVDAVDV